MLLLKNFLLLKNTKSNNCACSNNDNCYYYNNNSNYSIVSLRAISVYDRRKELSVCIAASTTYGTLSVCNYTILVNGGSDCRDEITPNVLAGITNRNRELCIGTASVSTLINVSCGVLAITCHSGRLAVVVSVNRGGSETVILKITLAYTVSCIREIKLNITIECLVYLELKSNECAGVVTSVILLCKNPNLNETACISYIRLALSYGNIFHVENIAISSLLEDKSILIKGSADLKLCKRTGIGINTYYILNSIARSNIERGVCKCTDRLSLSRKRELRTSLLGGDAYRRHGEHHNNNQKNYCDFFELHTFPFIPQKRHTLCFLFLKNQV